MTWRLDLEPIAGELFCRAWLCHEEYRYPVSGMTTEAARALQAVLEAQKEPVQAPVDDKKPAGAMERRPIW